jgi:hypothetical protein
MDGKRKQSRIAAQLIINVDLSGGKSPPKFLQDLEMGESLLLITIITLVVLTIRRARPVVLENPVIIQRSGQYHITLAPQLNRAQAFIEQIAAQFARSHPPSGDLPAQYFEVCDPKVFAQGQSFYLLAIALRGGMLYFQAVNPKPLLHDADSHYKTVREFSESVLQHHQLSDPADELWAEKLRLAVDTIAGQLKIAVKMLPQAG